MTKVPDRPPSIGELIELKNKQKQAAINSKKSRRPVRDDPPPADNV